MSQAPWEVVDMTLLDALNEGILVQDASGSFVYANAAAQRILTLPATDLATTTAFDARWEVRDENGHLWPVDELPIVRAARKGETIFGAQLDIRQDNGRRVWISVDVHPIDGGRRGAFAIFRDVTAERLASRQAGNNQHQLIDALFGSHLAVALSDDAGHVVRANRAFGQLVGRDPADVVGLHYTAFSGEEALADTKAAVDELRVGVKDQVQIHKTYRRPDGTIRHGLMNLMILRDDAGAPEFFLSLVHDLSDRLHAERELVAESMRDPLTGLLNRRGLYARLESALDDPGAALVCAFLDLDSFKPVNDLHGHEEGDRVLRAVATAISERVRAGDDVARIGGDEFVVLFRGATTATHERLAQILEESIATVEAPGDLVVAASVGCYTPELGDDANTVLREADLAMYEVKRRRHAVRTAR